MSELLEVEEAVAVYVNGERVGMWRDRGEKWDIQVVLEPVDR